MSHIERTIGIRCCRGNTIAQQIEHHNVIDNSAIGQNLNSRPTDCHNRLNSYRNFLNSSGIALFYQQSQCIEIDRQLVIAIRRNGKLIVMVTGSKIRNRIRFT